MKKLLFLLPILGMFSWAQTPVYRFQFNNTVSDAAQTNVSFTSSAANNVNYYTIDRFGNENAALSTFINNAVNYTANLPNLPLGHSPRSVSVWVSYQGFNDIPAFVDVFNYGNQNNNQRFGLRQLNNSIRAYGWANDLDTPSNVRFEFNNIEQSWYHYVMTFDGSNVKVYRNGHLILSGNKPEWNTSGSQFRLNVGSPTTAGAGVSYDDLEIYDVVLTEQQIKNMYIQQAGNTLLNDLVAYFSFDNDLSSSDGSHQFTLGHASHPMPSQAPGYFGNGYSFNNAMAANQSLSNVINTDNISFSFWSKRTGVQTANVSLVGMFNGFNFIRNPNNQNNVLLTHGSTANNQLTGLASEFVEDVMNEWTHHAVVFVKPFANSETRILRYYNNGILVRTLTVSNPMVKLNNAVTLGRTYNNTGVGLNTFFTALSDTTLDELMIFNKPLSQTEIIALSFMDANALSGLNCPSGDVTITSQAEADALAGCTHITGDLNILMPFPGAPLDFTPLNSITTIDGTLQISRVTNTGTWNIFPNLNSVGESILINRIGATTIEGFSNITTLASLSIANSNNLTTIHAFQNLQSLAPGFIEFFHCPILANIQPFSQLTSVEKINIAFCNQLAHLNFLSSVNTISSTTPFRFINFISNANLTDITGLNGIVGQPITSLLIENNPQLSTCAVNWVCNYLASPSFSGAIQGNATGCQSIVAVNAACEALSVDDFVMYEISVFPNPFVDFVEIHTPFSSNVQYEIYDMKGKTMIKNSTTDQNIRISNLGHLNKGVYLLKVSDNHGNTMTQKIVK